MPVDFTNYLVIGISSRALFNLEDENNIFVKEGLIKYREYQIEHENDILSPGAGFPLVQALLKLNNVTDSKRKVEVIIMSRNSTETSLRFFNSIERYGLNITRAALTGGASITPYLEAFKVDLFLSLHETDVQCAINAGVASAWIYPRITDPNEEIEQIRIAFDGDAVLFSDESEKIYKEKGLDAFQENERALAKKPLADGPFAKLLKSLSYIQSSTGNQFIRTALVTARNAPAHERVIRTLRAWNVSIDEAFFLGGMNKHEVLQAFAPHMFFDDQEVYCKPASEIVSTGRVPYVKSDEI